MRPLVMVVMVALAGCAGYDLEDIAPMEAPPAQPTNQTVEPVLEHVPASSYPVAAIATAPYTAPVEMVLEEVRGEAATLRLVADAQGLRCVAVPHVDALASPTGYKASGSWARCSLEVGGVTHTRASADTMAADLPLVQGIPVEPFTWNMSVGQVLVNNTGQHDEVRDEVAQEVFAAPDVHVHATLDQPYVCDTVRQMPVATLHIEAAARNGQAALQVDLEPFMVWGIDASVVAGNATDEGPRWWFDNGTLTVVGPWAGDATVHANITVLFQGQGRHLALLPPLECLDALYVDEQVMRLDATVAGIAAGWQAHEDHGVVIEVWHH